MSRDQHYIQVQHYLMRNMWSYLVFNNITNNFVVEIINWAPINSFFYILLLQGLKWNGSNVHNWKLKAREQILKLIRWFRSNIQFQNIIEWAKKYLQTLNSDWILKKSGQSLLHHTRFLNNRLLTVFYAVCWSYLLCL